MQVRFLQRVGAWFPGANPILDDVEARRLIAQGVCEKVPDEPAAEVKAESQSTVKASPTAHATPPKKTPEEVKADVANAPTRGIR